MDVDLSRSLREAAHWATDVSDEPAPAPLRRRVQRRRTATAAARGGIGLALATVVAMGTAQLAGSWDPHPVASTPRETGDVVPRPTSSAAPAPRLDDDSAWGPFAPYVVLHGVPHVGDRQWPQVDLVDSFTVVSSGVVYVDHESSHVVWEGWDRRVQVIGQVQGSAVADVVVGAVGNRPDSQHRHVVGSASGDLVAWVERNGAQRGDLVVVEAGTGAVLGRTPLPGPPDRSVVIAGVDEETVYLAFPDDPEAGPVPSGDVWIWRWASGEPPRSREYGGPADLVMDVSAGVWAVDMADAGRLQFQDEAGTRLSEVAAAYEDRTEFGGGLSPDGRYWYAPAYQEVVVTTTGERIPMSLPGGAFDRYAWTGASRLTFVIDRGLVVCDAATGACTRPAPVPYQYLCSGSRCGYELPAY